MQATRNARASTKIIPKVKRMRDDMGDFECWILNFEFWMAEPVGI